MNSNIECDLLATEILPALSLGGAHVFLQHTFLYCVSGSGSGSRQFPHEPRGCVLIVWSHVCPQSWCLCGDEVMAACREDGFTPQLRFVLGCCPRAAAAATFTLYRPREGEGESGTARVTRMSLPHSKIFLTKSGTPGSNQNTELWNKLTFHSLAGKENSSRDNFQFTTTAK